MADPLDKLNESSPSTPSLAAVFGVLRKRMWMICGILVAIPSLVGLAVSKQPKVYEATTSIVIDASVPQYLGQNFKDVVEISGDWWTQQETLQTELRVIKSYSQAVALAQAMCTKIIGPEKTPAMKLFSPTTRCDSNEDLASVAPLLEAALRVEPVKESRLVLLTVTGGNPELAALIANLSAQVYTERNLQRRLSQSEGAATWLGDEYGDLTSQLNESERALIDFKKKNNVVAVAIEDQQNDLSSRRKKLSDELNALQVKLINLKAQREQYARLKSDDPMNDVSPGVADSPVMLKLKELYLDQYSKLLELKGKYGDKHPAMMAQESRVTSIKADLVREAGLASKNVEAQYEVAITQEHDLRTALDATTHEALALEQKAIEYNRLKRNFDRLSKLSDQVGGRERETSLAGHLKTNNVRVLDAALVPTAAISPNLPRAVAVSVVVSLLFAFGLCFLLELLDSTVKTQEDIEKALGLSFLGLIPSIQPGQSSKGGEVAPPQAVADLVRGGSKDLYVLAHPKSTVAECCRAIRTNLLFMSPDRPQKSLLITSAGPQEGKSTTAINLAITMAQSGLKVLLVDTDMRRPRLHKAFGIPSTTFGLSSAIVGDADVVEMVRETGISNLSLLPCGASPPNPAELLHAERFRRIVSALTERYDRVLFDSPPVGAVTDAAILSRLTDGTVLVAKGGSTSKDAVGRARRILSGDGKVNVVGCILNDLDLTKQSGYGYYYYAKYGYYYQDSDARAAMPNQSSGG
jgi:capsular exopolysaccharide synthesis family protein